MRWHTLTHKIKKNPNYTSFERKGNRETLTLQIKIHEKKKE